MVGLVSTQRLLCVKRLGAYETGDHLRRSVLRWCLGSYNEIWRRRALVVLRSTRAVFDVLCSTITAFRITFGHGLKRVVSSASQMLFEHYRYKIRHLRTIQH